MSTVTATKTKTYDLAYIAIFAVLIAICSWISIPMTVPFTLQTFGVFMAVGVLGGKRGSLAVLVYILLGAIGVPVFAGFTGGISKLVSPTGGYLVGFIFTSVISGLIIEKFNYKRIPNIIGMIIGLAITYIFGTAWLAFGMGRTFMEALAVGVLPFLIFDFGKIIIVAIIGPELQKLMKKVA